MLVYKLGIHDESTILKLNTTAHSTNDV